MSGFLIVWAGQACSLLGSFLVQFALVGWLTMETGSAVVLSAAMTMAVLPRIFLGPFAGPTPQGCAGPSAACTRM